MDILMSGLARALLHNNLLGLLSGVLAIALLLTNRPRSQGEKWLTAAIWLLMATAAALAAPGAEEAESKEDLGA